LKIRLKIFQL